MPLSRSRPRWSPPGGQISLAARHQPGKRIGLHWPNVLATCVTTAAIVWCVAMVISFLGNQRLARETASLANAALAAPPGSPAALRAQLALQLQIDTFEYRQQNGTPLHLRAGLDRNSVLLEALWRPYQTVAARNLRQPVVQSLEADLTALSQIRADALQDPATTQRAYDALKAYLMLAGPDRTDAAFLTSQILKAWPAPPDMRIGEWLDLSQRLAGFYAARLRSHPEWHADASASLVATARSTLVNQIGLANADDTIYQRMLADVKDKYADASLATLLNGTDARGLFSTMQTVPGLYTRVAWDGMIAAAIDKAAGERRADDDWVLSGDANGTAGKSDSAIAERKARLTARYFAEYTRAWQTMLNSIQWRPAANLNNAIDQLTRLTDAQTSPLIALMQSLQHEALAGRPSLTLADTLVRQAKDLVGNRDKTEAPSANPLDKSFGPLLALMGDAGEGKGGPTTNPTSLSGVSLARYLAAATIMRLKLQQITASPDAQAMAGSLAQAAFQGKLSELAQARDDAALTAASLGAQWAGFGDALFARPLDTAWQTILQPAAASLNEAWRTGVAAPFKTAVDGRYPLFDTPADVSFAELGRYIRPDTGLIARFITAQLAGVLRPQGDHWIRNELAPQALQFDPAFLDAIRKLSTLGAQLYARGEASHRFDVMALPTPNVTQTEMTVDGKKIVYFNQQESWTPLAWPGDGLSGHARLTWQTHNAGKRLAFEATGDWAFLRMLSNASVRPLDSTRYELTWQDPGSERLHYVLRTHAGAGPLDLLRLRGFRMPERIFIVGNTAALPCQPFRPCPEHSPSASP